MGPTGPFLVGSQTYLHTHNKVLMEPKLKTFLEIGVADFDTLIPMAAKGDWTGYCVEPMPHHIESLNKMSKGLPVTICPFAVSDKNGTAKMAVGNDLERWATGANHIIDSNHLGERVLEIPANEFLRREDIEVTCLTLDALIDMYGITEIDFCKIDVEGHEVNILGNYSWKVKPKVIKCEHIHIPGNMLNHILTPQGYTIFVEENDIYCIL